MRYWMSRVPTLLAAVSAAGGAVSARPAAARGASPAAVDAGVPDAVPEGVVAGRRDAGAPGASVSLGSAILYLLECRRSPARSWRRRGQRLVGQVHAPRGGLSVKCAAPRDGFGGQ